MGFFKFGIVLIGLQFSVHASAQTCQDFFSAENLVSIENSNKLSTLPKITGQRLIPTSEVELQNIITWAIQKFPWGQDYQAVNVARKLTSIGIDGELAEAVLFNHLAAGGRLAELSGSKLASLIDSALKARNEKGESDSFERLILIRPDGQAHLGLKLPRAANLPNPWAVPEAARVGLPDLATFNPENKSLRLFRGGGSAMQYSQELHWMRFKEVIIYSIERPRREGAVVDRAAIRQAMLDGHLGERGELEEIGDHVLVLRRKSGERFEYDLRKISAVSKAGILETVIQPLENEPSVRAKPRRPRSWLGRIHESQRRGRGASGDK